MNHPKDIPDPILARVVNIVEAYPIQTQSLKLAGQRFSCDSGYMSVASAFRVLGFEQVGQASKTQLIIRLNKKSFTR